MCVLSYQDSSSVLTWNMTNQLQLFNKFGQKTDEDNNSTNPSALCLLTKRSMETVIKCVCAFVLVCVCCIRPNKHDHFLCFQISFCQMIRKILALSTVEPVAIKWLRTLQSTNKNRQAGVSVVLLSFGCCTVLTLGRWTVSHDMIYRPQVMISANLTGKKQCFIFTILDWTL